MTASAEKVFQDYLEKKSIFKNKDALSLNYSPDKIPHREKQVKNIAEILAPAMKKEKPSNIFLYGKTGTGKSLVASHVCDKLNNISGSKDIPISIVYLNCKMRKVTDTEYRLVAQLAREFGQEVPSTGLPTDEVYKIFFDTISDLESQTVIIFLDEIDMLIEKCGDEVLYNLIRVNEELDDSNLTLVGISNNANFTKNLDPRVKSSLGEEEIIFSPYDAVQLKDILSERATEAFNKGTLPQNVISKCAAYAAREHGDARRALNLLRISGEIAERKGREEVKEEDVDLAEQKIEIKKTEEIITTLPKQTKTVLYSIFLLCKSKNPPIHTGEIYDIYKKKCDKVSIKQLTQRRVSDLISELDMLGVINGKVTSNGRYGRTREISLSIPNNILDKVESLLESELGLN